jgi:hypothetical protein
MAAKKKLDGGKFSTAVLADSDTIEDAYRDELRKLFAVLCDSMASDRGGSERFANGLQLIRQARATALSLLKETT